MSELHENWHCARIKELLTAANVDPLLVSHVEFLAIEAYYAGKESGIKQALKIFERVREL
jgi:hypothetical protein